MSAAKKDDFGRFEAVVDVAVADALFTTLGLMDSRSAGKVLGAAVGRFHVHMGESMRGGAAKAKADLDGFARGFAEAVAAAAEDDVWNAAVRERPDDPAAKDMPPRAKAARSMRSVAHDKFDEAKRRRIEAADAARQAQ